MVFPSTTLFYGFTIKAPYASLFYVVIFMFIIKEIMKKTQKPEKLEE